MKKKLLLVMVVLFLAVGISYADMRSERKRIDAADILTNQQSRVDSLISQMTTVRSKLNTLKTRVGSTIGATEAAEVQSVIDDIKAQYQSASDSW